MRQHIAADESCAGGNVICPTCGENQSVPSASTLAVISFQCEHCGQSIVVEKAGAGLVVPCPKCGHKISVPDQTKQKSQPSAAVLNELNRSKRCPFCAETILSGARICRFCGYDLRTGKPAVRGSVLSPRHAILAILALAILTGGYIGYQEWKDKRVKVEMAANEERLAAEREKAQTEKRLAESKLAEARKLADETAALEAAKAAEEKRKAESFARIIEASETATSRIHEVDAALVVGINYERYS
jgi:DNA-directed RNA polymerase subunit RPC12/RpoP